MNLLGTSFFRRLVWLTLFLAPIGYTANIFAVAVHEIVGHGLVAQLLGGRFIGFWMKSDGMGGAFAFAAADAPVSHSIIILAGGVIATTLVGFILLVVAIVLRRWLLSRLVLLVLSAACLLEGPPYVFWNAYHPVPPGDIGRVFELCTLNGLADVTGLRWGLMIVGGGVTVTATFLLCLLSYRAIGEFLTGPHRMSRFQQCTVLLLFIAVPGAAAWFLFDWDQLTPGIGRVPDFVGATLMLATACVCTSCRPNRRPR